MKKTMPGSAITGNVLGGGSVLDAVEVLRARSLLHVTTVADGSLRFGLYEPIREFATEQLDAGADREAVRRRHAAYFAGLGRVAVARLALEHLAPGRARLVGDGDATS